jgi:protein-L-isoaspartate(D-aspartate) O-methyltransferase
MTEADRLRERMVLQDLSRKGIDDPRVLEAFGQVPREMFMPEGTGLREAYGDHPYPIGWGQTISQPFIVAYMIQMMDRNPGDLILEIGTGSGYQTAILAAMGYSVVTLEIIPQLAARGRRALLSVFPDPDVEFIVADGYMGWSAAAPYQGILVSAAPPRIPVQLEEQLDPGGGRMVIPAGDWSQSLILVERDGQSLTARESLPVRFVPLVRSGKGTGRDTR